jgi:hypothetical protein
MLVRPFLPAIVLILSTLAASAEGPEPIRVVTQVPAKPYYVGQSIELRVGAEAAGERPEVVAPSVANAEVTLIDRALSSVEASGIGEQTTERNLFITRFRIIPRSAGLLRIPPVRVRLGDRGGTGPPLTIDVRSLPVVGRPAEFLGGVGNFAVEAMIHPSSVRTGQVFTFTIRVTGPAARGMTASPSLDRLARVPLGLDVESLPGEAVDSPPSRLFRFRIRPTRAGESALPPLSIAAFDPQTAHYVTKVTTSLPIRVTAVPQFNPATLDYRIPTEPQSRLQIPGVSRHAIAAIALAIVLCVGSIIVHRTIRGRARRDPGGRLQRRLRELDPRHGSDRTARQIVEMLAEYLERTIGRPRGVLTPEEANSGVTAAKQDEAIGAQCARLITQCDQALYSGRQSGAAELVAGAQEAFEKIGPRGSRRGMRK